MFHHFVGLGLKGLKCCKMITISYSDICVFVFILKEKMKCPFLKSKSFIVYLWKQSVCINFIDVKIKNRKRRTCVRALKGLVFRISRRILGAAHCYCSKFPTFLDFFFQKKTQRQNWKSKIRGVFRTQSNIYDGANCFCNISISYMFDWVLNTPLKVHILQIRSMLTNFGHMLE